MFVVCEKSIVMGCCTSSQQRGETQASVSREDAANSTRLPQSGPSATFEHFWERRRRRLAAQATAQATSPHVHETVSQPSENTTVLSPQVDLFLQAFLRAASSNNSWSQDHNSPRSLESDFRQQLAHALYHLSVTLPSAMSEQQLDSCTSVYSYYGSAADRSGEHVVSSEYSQCVICMSAYEVGDSIRILPCLHRFHKMCVDEWLLKHSTPTCPICRFDPRSCEDHVVEEVVDEASSSSSDSDPAAVGDVIVSLALD